jgi:molybdopterin-guanine dinucleotide biosynthesis protein A
MAATLLESLVDFTRAGQRKIDRWTGSRRCATVVFDDASAFCNANTLEDLHRLQPR